MRITLVSGPSKIPIENRKSKIQNITEYGVTRRKKKKDAQNPGVHPSKIENPKSKMGFKWPVKKSWFLGFNTLIPKRQKRLPSPARFFLCVVTG
jgi:hypothetical protein